MNEHSVPDCRSSLLSSCRSLLPPDLPKSSLELLHRLLFKYEHNWIQTLPNRWPHVFPSINIARTTGPHAFEFIALLAGLKRCLLIGFGDGRPESGTSSLATALFEDSQSQSQAENDASLHSVNSRRKFYWDLDVQGDAAIARSWLVEVYKEGLLADPVIQQPQHEKIYQVLRSLCVNQLGELETDSGCVLTGHTIVYLPAQLDECRELQSVLHIGRMESSSGDTGEPISTNTLHSVSNYVPESTIASILSYPVPLPPLNTPPEHLVNVTLGVVFRDAILMGTDFVCTSSSDDLQKVTVYWKTYCDRLEYLKIALSLNGQWQLPSGCVRETLPTLNSWVKGGLGG